MAAEDYILRAGCLQVMPLKIAISTNVTSWHFPLFFYVLYFILNCRKDEVVGDDIGEYQKYKDMLWTAPKLLRMKEKRPFYGTQKGDIYSFGIIVQDVVYRDMPCFLDVFTPKCNLLLPCIPYMFQLLVLFQTTNRHFVEVIEKLIETTQPHYRPEIPKDEELVDIRINHLMKSCLTEDPATRPTFSDVRKHIKLLNQGKQVL